MKFQIKALIFFIIPVMLQSQPEFTSNRYDGFDLEGVTKQGIVESMDGTIFIFNGSDDKIFRYDAILDSFLIVECFACEGIEDLAILPDSSIVVALGFRGLYQISTSDAEEKILSGWINEVDVTADGRIIVLDDDENIQVYQDGEWIIYDLRDLGFNVNTTYDIAIDSSDIAWIATDAGLLRFDGSQVNLIPGTERKVFGVVVAPDQTVWIRLENALPLQWNGNNFEGIEGRYPFNVFSLSGLDITSTGDLWAISSQRGLFYDNFTGSSAIEIDYQDIGVDDSSPFIRRILIDRKDRIWITGDLDYVLRLDLVGSTTSARQIEILPLQAYPNPTNDYIYIQIPEGLSHVPTLLQVTDLSGRILFKKNLYTEAWPLSRAASKNDSSPAIKGSGGLFSSSPAGGPPLGIGRGQGLTFDNKKILEIPTQTWPQGNYQIILQTRDKIYSNQVVKTQ
ncbi:MAG: hypothetical protein KDC80_21545 [Saprospiraceae bacterium]|nr:hypothetical protein [Saprospiraceae bacterium]